MDFDLRSHAAARAGTLALSDALDNCSPRQLRRWRDSGLVSEPLPGALAVAGFPASPARTAWLAVHAVGAPCAVSGLTLAHLRGWVGCGSPSRPQLVVPQTREVGELRRHVDVRRLSHWPRSLTSGPTGLPALGAVLGAMTVAGQVADGEFHVLVQDLAYHGRLDVRALWERRRTGLPGSAQVTRVLEQYLMGLDSPQEVLVHNVLRCWGRPPSHLNVVVESSDGRRGGPYDGYSDAGVAYDVDGTAAHADDVQQARDGAKVAHAEVLGIELLRFGPREVAAREPMLNMWWSALETRASATAPGLRVIHLPGRHCVCGHRAW